LKRMASESGLTIGTVAHIAVSIGLNELEKAAQDEDKISSK
jgi:hypothetical protein